MQVFLSASEDGSVRLFDTRNAHECGQRCHNQVVHMQQLVPPLSKSGRLSEVELYSIDRNPADKNYFVVSGGDLVCRLFDIRKLRGVSSSCGVPVQYFCPQTSIDKANSTNARFGTGHVTSVKFTKDGTHFAASYSKLHFFFFLFIFLSFFLIIFSLLFEEMRFTFLT